MAALMEGFSLAKLAGESALIGVTKGEKTNQVIITSKTGFINVYQLSDQKLISSWSLRHGIQITCPTVWCSSKEEYLTVQNKQTSEAMQLLVSSILCGVLYISQHTRLRIPECSLKLQLKQLKLWTTETASFEKAKKRHIDVGINCILVEDNFFPVVVCENGRVDFQANIRESCTTGTLSEGEDILWCQSYITDRTTLSVILLTKSKNNQLSIHRHTYLADAECWRQKTSVLSRSADQMLTCCLSKKSEPSLLTLWHDGQLLDTSLTGAAGPEDSQEIASIPGIQTKSSIISLDHTHVAVAGIEKDGKIGLGIYNVKFQALQTWKPFPENVLTKANLYCHCEHLFLACNKTLYAFPYECQASTVARLLGQREKVKDPVPDAFHGVISWSTEKKTKKSANNDEIEKLFELLQDEKKKLPQKQFEKQFGKLMDYLSQPVNKHWLSSSHMSLLCRTCVSMTTFWPRQQIQHLIKHHLISHSDQTIFFDALIAHKDILLIHETCSTVPDVTEISLIKSLQCLLDMTDEDFSQECSDISIPVCLSDSSDDSKPPICNAKAFLLNNLLGMPFNDVFLIDCLRKLSFKNVLILLEYLYYLLKVLPMANTQHGDETNRPTPGKVIDWVALLIDAHVTQLIVSPDARMLLGNLHEIVTDQVEFCNQLSTLEAVLIQLKKKCTPVTQQKVGMYCIEVLHVR